jgi:hypothetical protein
LCISELLALAKVFAANSTWWLKQTYKRLSFVRRLRASGPAFQEVADLVGDFDGTGDRLTDLAAKEFAETSSHSMEQDADCVLVLLQCVRQLSIAAALGIPR